MGGGVSIEWGAPKHNQAYASGGEADREDRPV